MRSVPRGNARGLLLEGQVLKVWLPDDPQHPGYRTVNANISVPGSRVTAPVPLPIYKPGVLKQVLCDVLLFGDGYEGQTLRFVPVKSRGGRGDSDRWIPRGCRFDATGNTAIPSVPPSQPQGNASASVPGNLDGDLVLIGFISGDIARPIIMGPLDHPWAEEALPAYRAVTSLLGPSNVRTMRHRGSKVTIDSDGNVTVDATGASSGACDVRGVETVGAGGSITIKAKVAQVVRIEGGTVDLAQPAAVANRPVARGPAVPGGAGDPTVVDASTDLAWSVFWTGIEAAINALPVAAHDGGAMLKAGLATLFGTHGATLTGQITSGNANVRTD